MSKVNNKNTRTISSVFIVNSEQVNVSWDMIKQNYLKTLPIFGLCFHFKPLTFACSSMDNFLLPIPVSAET